jgi:Arm DNA-binding domain
MPKLTVKLIGDIRKPASGQVIYRDDEVKGFGLRVTAGAMSYICERRVNGKVQRRTIGRADLLSPEEARKQARRVLAEMGAANEHTTFKVPTLAELVAVYPTKKRLRESTITNYRQVVRRYLSAWEDLPVTANSQR